MTKPKLPSLLAKLLEAQTYLYKSDRFTDILEDVQGDDEYIFPDYEVECFPQIWSSSTCGIDIDANGEHVSGTDALIKEYTTVVHELMTDSYVVFFGDCIAYLVTDPTDAFMDDLSARKLASVFTAKERY